MIGDFLHGLRGDLREACLPRCCQRGEIELLEVVEQQLPRNRLREITVSLFNQQAIAEIHDVAPKRQLIGIAAIALEVGSKSEKMRGLSDQIERNVRQRQVDFKRWRVPAPF